MKTIPGVISVEEYLDGIEVPQKRADIEILIPLLREITGDEPLMYGTGIVGFGQYPFRVEKGVQLYWMVLGCSARKQSTTVYYHGNLHNEEEILSRIGKHSHGSSCLHFKKLADANMDVLRELLEKSWKNRPV
jgi:hypothetical protein